MHRSCTTLLSSRTLSRSVRSQSRRLVLRTRQYSATASGDATTEGENGQKDRGVESANDAANTETKAETELLTKLKAKEAEVVELTGRLRYLQADFMNLQRNAAREKEQTRDFAITRFASDLLETVDVLTMALKSVPQSVLTPDSPAKSPPTTTPPSESSKSAAAHLNELYIGVEATHRQLLQTLFKYHVKPFDPTGDNFDPNRHEALYQAPLPGKQPGTVIDCQKIGYTIKDRILRAAQVGVAQEIQS